MWSLDIAAGFEVEFEGTIQGDMVSIRHMSKYARASKQIAIKLWSRNAILLRFLEVR